MRGDQRFVRGPDLEGAPDLEPEFASRTEEQRAGGERRVLEHETNPGVYQTWDVVRREFEEGLKRWRR